MCLFVGFNVKKLGCGSKLMNRILSFLISTNFGSIKLFLCNPRIILRMNELLVVNFPHVNEAGGPREFRHSGARGSASGDLGLGTR